MSVPLLIFEVVDVGECMTLILAPGNGRRNEAAVVPGVANRTK